jgi:hypothetical protein
MIKSRRIRWVGHEVCMGEMRNAYRSSVGNPKGRYHFRDLRIDMRIKLK